MTQCHGERGEKIVINFGGRFRVCLMAMNIRFCGRLTYYGILSSDATDGRRKVFRIANSQNSEQQILEIAAIPSVQPRKQPALQVQRQVEVVSPVLQKTRANQPPSKC